MSCYKKKYIFILAGHRSKSFGVFFFFFINLKLEKEKNYGAMPTLWNISHWRILKKMTLFEDFGTPDFIDMFHVGAGFKYWNCLSVKNIK